MRVLYSFPHTIGGPGINTTAWQQVEHLAGLGAEVTVYCTNLRTPFSSRVDVVETMTVAGRRIPHRALGRDRAFRYHDARVARRVRRSSAEFDVVHTWPTACLATAAAARSAGLPCLREAPNAHTALTYRESEAACRAVGVELPDGASHKFDAKRLARECAEFDAVSGVLAPSDFVAASFVSEGYPIAKIFRHRYGYDPAAFPAPEGPRPDRPFTGIFVGRGEPHKGLHLALEAWFDAGLADTGTFVILGSLMPEYAAVLARYLDHPRIERRGFVSDVGAVLREADVLVFPSMTEGSALVSYESIACGVVPLVSAAVGAPVDDGATGLVHEPGDVAALSGHLRRLASDPADLARLRAGALSVRDQLTWREGARQLLVAYAEATER